MNYQEYCYIVAELETDWYNLWEVAAKHVSVPLLLQSSPNVKGKTNHLCFNLSNAMDLQRDLG
jgi:hypothetical protein